MLTHSNEIKRLTDDNNLTTTKPYPGRAIFNCQTKRESTPMVDTHNMMQTPHYLVYVLTAEVISTKRRQSIVDFLHR